MRPITPLLLLLALFARPAHASNDLHRCIGADGTLIFTDQKCEDIGAVQRVDPPPVAGNIGYGFSRLHANACARSPSNLLLGIENAIHAGDVNELATFYHWPGVSSGGSIAIFKRLQKLIDHPLLSIELLYAHRSHDGSLSDLPSEDSRIDETRDDSAPRQAYGMQIVQDRSERDAMPMRSTLSLRRNIGCWWVQF